jgi:hypothetical protein
LESQSHWGVNFEGSIQIQEKSLPKSEMGKLFWFDDLTPSKSLLVWRFILDKLPTYENLITRGWQLPFM